MAHAFLRFAGRSFPCGLAFCAAFAFPGAAGAAAADDPAGPAISLRGFGTLGAVHASERNADFVGGFFQPNGAGHTHRWALGVDSKLGVQVDARITEQLSATLQLVGQHRYDNSYTPQVEWANLKYRVTPDLDVRFGRTVTMPFMVSDSRLVGYSNPWIRPPQEVYGLIPLTNKDGVDATYRIHIGDVTNAIHTSYGQTSARLPASGKVTAKHYFDISNTVEYGPASVRASYSTGRVDLHTPALDTLIAGLTQFGNAASALPPFAAAGAQSLGLAQKYRFEDAPISIIALGASYDRDRWLLMAEWARFNGHSLLADSTAWYATGAYRIGAFTPYLTLARLKPDRGAEPGITAAGLPPPLAATATALNTGLNTAIAGATFGQRSLAAGLRWDFMKNTSLKLQYDRVNLDAGSSGRLGNVQPGFQSGGNVHVFSVAVDFVF